MQQYLAELDTVSLSFILFSFLVLVGVIAENIAKRIPGLPIISGCILAGLLIGPGGLGLIAAPWLDITAIFVDICFGLILFELGKNFNFAWRLYDPWLLLSGIFSSLLSFIMIFIVLRMFRFSVINASLVASVGIVTSPAVIFLLAKELKLDTPVVRRTKGLVAINNVIGLLVLITILPYLHYTYNWQVDSPWLQPVYLLLGSITIAFLSYLLTLLLTWLVGKNETQQFIIFIAMILLNIGIAYATNLSVLIILLFYGIFIRNGNFGYGLLNVDFGNISDLFALLLLVITGANLHWEGIDKYFWPVLTLLAARALGQFIPTYFCAKKSGFTNKQATAIGLALTPMAATALGISQTAMKMYPQFGVEVSQIIIISLLFMQLIGPIITKWSFQHTTT